MEFSQVHQEVIEKGNLKSYIEKNGKEIHRHGTHELIGFYKNDIGYWLNLDVGDDYTTPYFHVRVDSDEDLEIFDNFEEAFENYQKRISE